MIEQRWAPYTVPAFQIPPMHACFVYITHFTNDNINVAYYIEEAHITSFLAGTFGIQAYKGPALITPIGNSSMRRLVKNVTKVGSTSDPQLRVHKNDTPLEKVRWRYLYETARIQWAKLKFDPARWAKLKDREVQIRSAPKSKDNEQTTWTFGQLVDMDEDEDEDEDEDDDENEIDADWEISSVTSCEAQNSLKATGRNMVKAKEIEEPGRDNENSTNIPIGDAKTSDPDSPGGGLDILKLLDSILRSGGNSDDLLAYLAKRDAFGNFVGVRRLKEKVVGLVDTLSLIDDLEEQNQLDEALGIGPSDVAAEQERVEFIDTRDQFIADIHRIMALPEESRDDFSGSSDDDEANVQQFPNLDIKNLVKLTDEVSIATAQPTDIATRLLQNNKWNAKVAIESWFDMIEHDSFLEDEAPQITSTHQYSVASSSGTKFQAEATAEELAADRARLERLIAQGETVQETQQTTPQQHAQHDPSSNHTANITKKQSVEFLSKSRTPTSSSSLPPQPLNFTQGFEPFQTVMANAYTTPFTFQADTAVNPFSPQKPPLLQNLPTTAANTLACKGKKGPAKPQWYQQAIRSADDLALMKQAVQKHEKSMENMASLIALTKAKLDGIEEARRDSAMDLGAITAGAMEVDFADRRADREMFAEEDEDVDVDGDEALGEREDAEEP